jgi:hypothetical protein
MRQLDAEVRESGDSRRAFQRAGVGVILFVTLAFCVAFITRSGERYADELYFTLFDDAMISMTYARNLAEGNGLLWNAGDAPVEGYTNFLWTLWMAVLHLLPIAESKLSLLVMGSGVLLLLANALVVAALARRMELASSAAFLFAVGATALCYPLIYWTLRGMEVGLLALLVSLALLQALRLVDSGSPREAWGLGGLLAAALLVRPDSVVAVIAMGAFVALTVPRSARVRAVLPIAVCVVATLGLHTAFRVAYYGDPLPNTYYLKVTGYLLEVRVGRGASVFADSLRRHLWPLLLFGAVALLDARTRRLPAFRLLAVVAAMQCAYSVWVGGDAWETFVFANRFVAVVLPCFVLCAAKGIDTVVARVSVGAWGDRRSLVGVVATVCVLITWFPVNGPHFLRGYLAGAIVSDKDHSLARRGLRIRERTPEDTRIGVMAAGAVPYYARRYSIDLLGKSDPVIAHSPPIDPSVFYPGHSKWDYRYSLGELRPDLIVQVALLIKGDRAYVKSLDYVRAPRSLGSYMTRELGQRLKRPAATE